MSAPITDETLFKALDGHQATHGGAYTYRRNTWTARIPNLVPCASGYHLARGIQVLTWLSPTLWVAETRGDVVDHGVKLVAESIRIVDRVDTWNDRTARLFAADCAEGVLLGERASGREPDERSWAAVTVARQYANGEIGDAARAAAGDAARAAARAAARDAARAAARDAAWAAARVAAWVAARDAADAAGEAAWAAAGAAAWDAAWAAAWDAAWAAAWAAARDAAWDAARDAQWGRLKLYLNNEPIPAVRPLYGAANVAT